MSLGRCYRRFPPRVIPRRQYPARSARLVAMLEERDCEKAIFAVAPLGTVTGDRPASHRGEITPEKRTGRIKTPIPCSRAATGVRVRLAGRRRAPLPGP